MRAENLTTRPRDSRYLRNTLLILGTIAVSASFYVAWPALAHLGGKLV